MLQDLRRNMRDGFIGERKDRSASTVHRHAGATYGRAGLGRYMLTVILLPDPLTFLPQHV